MDETQFEQFLDEFQEYHADMIHEMGVIGLQSIRQQNDQDVSPFYDSRDTLYPNRMEGSWEGNDANDGLLDRGSVYQNMVADLKSHTYDVSVTNIFEDLTYPLFEKMDELAFDQQKYESRMQYSTEVYLTAILRAVRDLPRETSSGVLGGIQASWQTFMRAPLWNSLIGIIRGLKWSVSQLAKNAVIPLLKGAWNLLTGWGKDTIQHKIFDELKKQTQFMRTGEMGGPRSVFERIKDSGIIGTVAQTAVGDFLTTKEFDEKGNRLSPQEVAQRRQTRRERNLGVENTISGRIIDRLYRDDVVQRGVMRPVEKSKLDDLQERFFEERAVYIESSSIKELSDSIAGRLNFTPERQASQDTQERINFDHSIISTQRDSIAGRLNFTPERQASQDTQERINFDHSIISTQRDSIINPRVDMVGSYEGGVDRVRERDDFDPSILEDITLKIAPSKRFEADHISPLVEEIKAQQRFDELIRDEDEKRFAQQASSDNTMTSHLKHIRGNTKETATETERLRRQGLIGMIGGVISGIANTVATAIGSISSTLSGILGAALGAAGLGIGGLLKKVFKRGGGAAASTGRAATGAAGAGAAASTAGKLGVVGRLGAPLAILGGVAETASIWTDDQASIGEKVQATGGVAGGTAGALGGAKAGAALGTLAGPVGTVVGGLIGGGLGYLGGSKLGKSITGFIPGVGDETTESDDTSIFSRIWGWIREIPGKVKEGVSDALNEADDQGVTRAERISQTASSAYSSVSDKTRGVYESSRDRIGGLIGRVEEQTQEEGGDSIGGVVSSLSDRISSGFSSLSSSISEAIKGSSDFERIQQRRSEGITRIVSDQMERGSDVFGALQETLTTTSVEALETARRTLNLQSSTKEATDLVASGVSTSNEYLKKMTDILSQMQTSARSNAAPPEGAEDNSGYLSRMRNYMTGGIPGMLSGD